jgi:hypothetical protein
MFVGGAVHDWTLVGVGFVLFGAWYVRSAVREDRRMKAEYAAIKAREAEEATEEAEKEAGQPKNASASA